MNIEITQPEIEIEAHNLDCKIDAIKAEFSEQFDEEDVEMLIQLSMKLGELFAQRDFNKKLEGCVVVPVEPTNAMERAGFDVGAGFLANTIYKAMVEAARGGK